MPGALLSPRQTRRYQEDNEVFRSPHVEETPHTGSEVYVPQEIQKPPRSIAEVNLFVVSGCPLSRCTNGYASIAAITHALSFPLAIDLPDSFEGVNLFAISNCPLSLTSPSSTSIVTSADLHSPAVWLWWWTRKSGSKCCPAYQ